MLLGLGLLIGGFVTLGYALVDASQTKVVSTPTVIAGLIMIVGSILMGIFNR